MSTINTILYDVDGVIIDRHEYFSKKFSREFNVPYDKITPFFGSRFQECLVGKADLKTELPNYLSLWKWDKTVDNFLDYWFESESSINQKMIDSITRLRETGLVCGIHTNNEKYRTNFLLSKMGLKQHFDHVFSSSNLKCKKPEEEFWQEIYGRLNSPNKESILVIDDDIQNINSAKSFGFTVHLYNKFNEYQNLINSVS